MMKKMLLCSTLWFFLIVGSPLYSSLPAQSSALTAQDTVHFKGLTCEQEESFFSALSGETTDVISTFEPAVVGENAYAFTKAAIVVHNKSFFEYFLSKLSPASLQTKDDNGYSLLHVAAEVGNAPAVQELIKNGLSVNDKTLANGKNPLHLAYAFNPVANEKFDPRVVQLLVSNNPDLVNEFDAFGKTALHYAALGGNTDMFSELLAQGANPDIVDKNGCIALDYAILARNTAIAERLFSHIGDTYSHFDKNTILKLMSRFIYDLDSKGILQTKHHFSSKELQDLLLDAAKKGSSASIITLLIENGANPNVRANCGCTPLIIAVQNRHIKTARELLTAHADPNAADANGFTPLHVAAEKGYVEIVEELLAAHANPNALSNFCSTPLYVVVKSKFFERAAYSNAVRIVRMLLDAGANPDLRARDHRTPIDIATGFYCRQSEIVTLLFGASSLCTIQ